MTKTLFLDDNEDRQNTFFKAWMLSRKNGDSLMQTRTVEETIDALKTKGPFDEVYLDHDLGGKVYVKEIEGTGYQVALFIERELDESLLPKRIILHSYNDAGASRMHEALNNRKIPTYRIPFGMG